MGPKRRLPLWVPPLESMSHVRAKVYGRTLDARAMRAILDDVVAGRYSDIHLAAFLTACAGDRLDLAETTALTRAMVDVGERLDWGRAPIVDKHSVGGLPGNRTTPIVVSIVAAHGLTIPKTSSRAITSPAGTADVMETLTTIALDLPAIRRVVEREGGCLVWGGAVGLSPADDILIRVEQPLDLDSEGQLVASVLSKKVAAGATHVVLDMPVGPTAKVRTETDALELSGHLESVGREIGLTVRAVRTDGRQPVGRGIGPALEARDVLAVLRGEANAPADLRARACLLAGELLELGGAAADGRGRDTAADMLSDGRALAKFMAICEAQGGFTEPPASPLRHDLTALSAGIVSSIDNRLLARIAKLGGAPSARSAGVDLHVKLGQKVGKGEPLLTLHSEARGELDYALAFADANRHVIELRAE